MSRLPGNHMHEGRPCKYAKPSIKIMGDYVNNSGSALRKGLMQWQPEE
jgi:hypothetical protein